MNRITWQGRVSIGGYFLLAYTCNRWLKKIIISFFVMTTIKDFHGSRFSCQYMLRHIPGDFLRFCNEFKKPGQDIFYLINRKKLLAIKLYFSVHIIFITENKIFPNKNNHNHGKWIRFLNKNNYLLPSLIFFDISLK